VRKSPSKESKQTREEDHNSITAPTIEPMTNVPAVTTKHSQPGSVADNIPAEELVLFEVLRGLAVEVEAVVVLVL